MTLSREGYLYQIGYVMSIFAMYPMVEGGDGITSAMDRFGPFFRVSTSIGLYSVDLRSEGVRGSSYRSLSGPMSAMVGCREKSWSAKKIWRKAAGANLTSQTLHWVGVGEMGVCSVMFPSKCFIKP